MARIFAGELTKIDREVVERLRKELPDDFSVLAEVNVGRNVDYVIIRPNGDAPALLIAAETKHVFRTLFGQTDGQWRELTDCGDWKLIEPSNQNDINYYWQAVHSADALKRWLWCNQRIFRDDDDALDGNRFAVWPDLVLLGDPAIAHSLPDGPASRFGQWYFGFDAWVRHLLTWDARVGVALRQREIDRLIEAMGLMELPADWSWLRPVDNKPSDDLASAVRDLSERVVTLEAMLAGNARPVMPVARPYAITAAARAS